MLDIKVLLEIRHNAIQSMKRDSDDEQIESKWKKFVFILAFYCIPVSLALIAWYKEIKLTSLEQYIGASIAIFTGLFFSLLLNIGSKIRSEKENPNVDNENFLQFKKSMKQIANITLYEIILGIIIFLLMLLNSILKSNSYPLFEQTLTILTIYLLGQYIVSLFFMMQRYFYIVRDELNSVL
jgi:hypothetical protein